MDNWLAIVVAIAAGLLSGAFGSWIGARAQKEIARDLASQERGKVLWAYHLALRDYADNLERWTLGMSEREPGEGEPKLFAARAAAWEFLHTLPADLGKELRNPTPDVQSSAEAAMQLAALADRLSMVLRTEHQGQISGLRRRIDAVRGRHPTV